MGMTCSHPLTEKEYWNMVHEFRQTVLEKRFNRFHIVCDEKKKDIQITVDVPNDVQANDVDCLKKTQEWWRSWWNTRINWSFSPDQTNQLPNWSNSSFQPYFICNNNEMKINWNSKEYYTKKLNHTWKGRWKNGIVIRLVFQLHPGEYLDLGIGSERETNMKSNRYRLGPEYISF